MDVKSKLTVDGIRVLTTEDHVEAKIGNVITLVPTTEVIAGHTVDEIALFTSAELTQEETIDAILIKRIKKLFN